MRCKDKVVFITGAARGQGRSHAVHLAREGADLILADICAPVPTSNIRPSTPEDLQDTIAAVKAVRSDTRIIARHADVRDPAELEAVVDEGVAELGKLDAAIANAAILNYAEFDDFTLEMFQACIDVNLTGVFNTCKASVKHLRANGGGSLVLISSSAGVKGQPLTPGYTAAKHGVVGLCNGLAVELGADNIRVNSIHPAGVLTPMGEAPGLVDILNRYPATLAPTMINSLPITMMKPEDISNGVVYLVSDESRAVSGLQMRIDCGLSCR